MENHIFLMGKLTINFTAIFNSYVKLPEGKASICREIPHVYVHSNILGMSLHDMKQIDKKKKPLYMV